ncbi:hypothetical protein OHQ88_10495 [Micromonospora zamorensis]|uniref:hypothetical protein n=1 Tax=Micromonospora zamorensis TaxID=709883 RepID=UPI002E22E959
MARVVRALNSAAANMTVKLVAFLALGLSVYVNVQQVQLTSCLADYNEASNRSQAARYEAAEQDRQAQDRLFRSIAEDPRSGIEALRQYNLSRDEANATRQANPLPAPPSQRC